MVDFDVYRKKKRWMCSVFDVNWLEQVVEDSYNESYLIYLSGKQEVSIMFHVHCTWKNEII